MVRYCHCHECQPIVVAAAGVAAAAAAGVVDVYVSIYNLQFHVLT
jgi:hypothetical protein